MQTHLINPRNGKPEICTIMEGYNDGKDWVRFDDGGKYPMLSLEMEPRDETNIQTASEV